MKPFRFVISLCAASVMTLSAHAQDPQASGYHYKLPLDVAIDAAQEAIRVCEAKQYWVTATVVDMDGVPQVVLRGDRATVHTGESSFRKAFTVVTLGPEFYFDRSSGFFELMKTSPFAPQLATTHNVMALPGALAFKVKGEMVGALGIGGAPGGDKDEVCATAGVAKVADRLPH
jgi:uncharacterized protein GlcG (DUF336 family)